jgi:hypothetical protein
VVAQPVLEHTYPFQVGRVATTDGNTRYLRTPYQSGSNWAIDIFDSNHQLLSSPVLDLPANGLTDKLKTLTLEKRKQFLVDLRDSEGCGQNKIGVVDDKIVEAWDALKKTGLRLDLDIWLPTVSRWLDEGVTFVDDVLPVKFLHNGNEIATIVNDKLIPSKFQFEGIVINEVKLPGQTFGKDVVKGSDGTIGFRINFKKLRFIEQCQMKSGKVYKQVMDCHLVMGQRILYLQLNPTLRATLANRAMMYLLSLLFNQRLFRN